MYFTRWSRASQESSLSKALVHPLYYMYYLYLLHTFITCRTSNNFVLQMPQHKKKKYNLTHFCELKAGWSYRLTLSCLAVRCNWMSQREMRAKPLLYSSGHMPEWRPHYWNGHTHLKKLTDFERLILLVYKYLDERAYRILSTFEYNWISLNLSKALHDPEGSEKTLNDVWSFAALILNDPDWSWPTLDGSEDSFIFFHNPEGAYKWPWSTTWNPKVRALNLTGSLWVGWVGLDKRLTQFVLSSPVRAKGIILCSMFLQFITRCKFRWDPSTSFTHQPSVLSCRIVRPTSLPAIASIAINLQIKSRMKNSREYTGMLSWKMKMTCSEPYVLCPACLQWSVLRDLSPHGLTTCQWEKERATLFAVERTGTLLHADLFP